MILCLVVMGLHLVVLLHAGGMWRDEINSIGVAEAKSPGEFWQLLRIATFPIPYFGLLRLWIELTGGGDGALRVLVFLVGVLIPLALWFTASLLRPTLGSKGDSASEGPGAGRSLPLISLALFGLNADALWHGDMVRGYGLATIFTILSVGFVWKLAVSPSRTNAVLATLAAVGTTQCLFQNAFLVMAVGVAGAAVALRNRFGKRALLILGVGATAAAGLALYIPLALQSRELHVLDQGGFVLQDAITVTLRTLNSSGNFMAVVWGVLVLVAVVVAVIAQFPKLMRLSPEMRDLAFYVAIALPLSVAGFFFFFFVVLKHGIAPRYFTVPLAFVAVCLDGLAAALPPTRTRRMMVLGLAVLVAAVSFPKAWTQSHMRHTNLDLLAQKIQSTAGKDDLIVVMPCMYGATFHRYYRGETPWITLPEIADFQIQRDDLWKDKLATTNATASALAKMSRTLQSGNKVWFVGQPVFLPEGQKPPALPPAPFGPQGWYYEPYEKMWAMEAGDFLQKHAASASVLRKRGKDVHPDENLPLVVFEGWRRDDTPAPMSK